jgi:Zn-dependent protease with chaperone function/TolA-binding protein
MSPAVATGWLVQLALGGGLLLLLARLVMTRIGAPSARGKLGELGVLSALLLGALALGPRWLPVAVPGWAVSAPLAQRTETPLPIEPTVPELFEEDWAVVDLPEVPNPAAPRESAAVAPNPQPVSGNVAWSERVVQALLLGYATVAGLFLVRWLLAHAALAWLLRGATPAPAPVIEILDELSPPRGSRLVVSSRIRVPFSYGLLRPTMVLPESMVDAPPQVLRWVLAHERAHVQHGDGWAGLLLALGQAMFFFVPWFWWLRRQVRLCQEHVADAAAVAAGGRPEDYAEFLLGWVAAPRAPIVGTGVFGSSSDLYRRVTMLLQGRPLQPDARSRGWLAGAGAGLLALAVVLAGLHVVPQVSADPARDERKPAPEKPKKDSKDEKKAPALPGLPDVKKLLDNLPAMDEKQIKELRDRLEAMRKQIEQQSEQLRKQIEEQTARMRRQMEQQAEQMRRQTERMQPFGRSEVFAFGELNRRLGARLRPPEPALAAQLALPNGQGQVLETVRPNSAAAKAGLRSHDILLSLDGKAVPSKREEFAQLLKGVKPDTPVAAVVVRKGKKETIKGLSLSVAK